MLGTQVLAKLLGSVEASITQTALIAFFRMMRAAMLRQIRRLAKHSATKFALQWLQLSMSSHMHC